MIENSATVDQKKPNGKGREIAPLVIEDLLSRVKKGIKTYGEPLKLDNGRDPLIDLYQELLDGAMYIRQELEQRKKTWFPKTIFACNGTFSTQIEHMASEAREFLTEYNCFINCLQPEDAHELMVRMFDEATDFCHSYDSMKYIMPREIKDSQDRVIEKNNSRGYYVK